MAMFDDTITENIAKSLAEIPHPSLPKGSNIYGGTKIFPDYQAEEGETYFTLVHGIAHESSVSFVAVLQATRALRKGFESAIYFYGPGAINCLATRGFPKTGDSGFPRRAEHQRRVGDLHQGGWNRLCVSVRTRVARWAGRRSDRGRHSGTSARRAGRADSLRPQGCDHQLHLHGLIVEIPTPRETFT